MLQLLGLNKEVGIEIREKLSILPKHIEEKINGLLDICQDAAIISTCNRVEIYFNSDSYGENIIEAVFKILNWDINLSEYIFYICNEHKVIEHLMEVSCGFNSLILGEDQILSQVKLSYEYAKNVNPKHSKICRLFQSAITCGKEFRNISSLNKIPVSSASIAVNEARKAGLKRFMVLGYGEVGELTSKYIISGDFEVLYIAVRNVNNVKIDDPRVIVIPFKEREKYYEQAQCIISCTSAPHTVIKKADLMGQEKLIFDLALPRDVDMDVKELEKITLYDIDELSKMDMENRKKRKDKMFHNKYIIDKYVSEYENWLVINSIKSEFEELKKCGEEVYKKRYNTFKNKKETKDNDELVKVLLRSTSDAYVNRAIDVLKEEQVEGRGEECLRLIKKIFYSAQ